MKKKGQVELMIFALVFFIILVVAVAIGGVLVKDVASGLGNSSTVPDQGKEMINKSAGSWDTLWDNIFLMAFILVWLGLAILFFFVPSHPVIAIPGIVVLVVLLFIAPMLSNFFAVFSSNGIFDPSAYPKTSFILNNYMMFILGMGLTSVISLYAKGRIQ